jgi:hypothetical protein
MRGGDVDLPCSESDRGGVQGPQQFDDLVDGQAGAGLGLAGDRERVEHDREVGVRSGRQIVVQRPGYGR